MNIDETTGLPDISHIPGNVYWEIEKYSHSRRTGYALSLKEEKEVDTISRQQFTEEVPNPEYRWWNNKTKTISNKYFREVPKKDLRTRTLFIEGIGELDEENYRIFQNHHFDVNLNPEDFRKAEISKEQILESAKIILNRYSEWEDQLTKEELSNQFIGKYPPKTL